MPIRYYTYDRGEVTWEQLALKLDRRDAAWWGTSAYVLVGLLDIHSVRRIIAFARAVLT